MAHQIENMMYVGEVPWHGLGVALEEAPSCADAIRCAGLDWTVGLKPLCTYTEDEGNMVAGEVVTHRASFRESDGKILGVVGPAWTPLQNIQAFDFFNPMIESGMATLETAGSLRGGRRVWILAKLKSDPCLIVKSADDKVEKYVLLANGHDGVFGIYTGFTPIRTVCANTLSMAISNKESRLLRLSHKKNILDALKDVREAMNLANAAFETTAEHYRKLAAHQIVNEDDLRRYVSRVFPAPKKVVDLFVDAPKNEDEISESGARIFPKVQKLFESGRGNTLPGVRGTYWAAYNAVTEYVAHERGSDREKRLDQTWFGAGTSINRKALTVALEMVAA